MSEPTDQSAAAGWAAADHIERVVLTAGERLIRAADRLQQRLPWLAFPVAVGKKFSDDQAGNLAGTFLGGCGVAGAAQNALNWAWMVPFSRRPPFPWNQLRNLGFVVVVGLGQIATSLLSGAIGGSGHILSGAGARIGATVVALALNIILFWGGFRLAAASMVIGRQLWLGAMAAATAWQALQLARGVIVAYTLAASSSLYGTFGIVLGLLTWLYLQAQITLLAVEIDVVRTRGLWPRSLRPPLTPQDMTAYRLYARAEQRRRGIDIEVADSDIARSASANER